MTIGLITPPTEEQETQFNSMVTSAVRSAREKVFLNKVAMQRFLGNGGKFQEDVAASLLRLSASDETFVLLKSFKLTVPKGYNHGTQLATFAAQFQMSKEPDMANLHDEDVSDVNYAGASHKLIPGKTYLVSIFGVNKMIVLEDCLEFLASQKAILTGAQGLTLAWQLKKEKFPISRTIVSLDKEDALPKGTGSFHHLVPLILRGSSGIYATGCCIFEGIIDANHCLICFRDLNAFRCLLV